jgi:hypothetical protein
MFGKIQNKHGTATRHAEGRVREESFNESKRASSAKSTGDSRPVCLPPSFEIHLNLFERLAFGLW